MNKKMIIGVTVIVLSAVVLFSGCSASKVSGPVKSVSTDVQQKPGENKALPITTPAPISTKTPADALWFATTTVPGNTKISFNTPWEVSPDGKHMASLEGRGDKAQEEGYADIIIKDLKSGAIRKLILKDEKRLELTARDIEWLNDNDLFVILGQPYGTVSMGGKIYKVDLENGEALLYADTTDLEEYISVHKTAEGFKFTKYVYEDDNFTKGHIESGILKNSDK